MNKTAATGGDRPEALVERGRSALDTPTLLVDLDVLEANIVRIAETCRASGIGWRPHIKSQKTVEIVRKELDAGAIGITCAKLGEAEVMAEHGVRDILIANQVVGPIKIRRLIDLLDRAEPVVAVESRDNVAALSRAAAGAGKTLRVVIEVNIGMNRAGVEPGAPVVSLADAIAASPGLRFAGLMAWESHAVLIADPAEKERVVATAIARLTYSAEACRGTGHTVEIVSCGGTGTFPYCIRQPGVTEVQVGGGIFSDMHYRNDYHVDFPFALTLLTTVTCRPNPTRIVVDAGRKAMSCDAAMPQPQNLPTVKSLKLSAEHTTIELEAPSASPMVGELVEFVVGYSDTTVHLHEELVALRGGRIVAVWPIVARGRIK